MHTSSLQCVDQYMCVYMCGYAFTLDNMCRLTREAARGWCTRCDTQKSHRACSSALQVQGLQILGIRLSEEALRAPTQ